MATLYDYEFVYKDGSYYYGTVADNGSKGYYSGETINGYNGGYYYIYNNEGSTSETSGRVSTSSYYDSTSGKSYKPYYSGVNGYDGSSGLGSESDYTYGAKGYQYYGSSGYYEAKQGGSTTLYDYEFVYKDGSYYYGTVADNGSKGYYSGETINGYNGGYYYIYNNEGSTSETSGRVSTSSYYDSTSGKSYKPYYSGVNGYDGSSGLGSESDYTYGAKGYQYYGSSGYYEAKQGGSTTLYDYEFVYKDGSYYYGTVADNGSKGYYSGEKINGYNGGYYYIYNNEGSTSETSGRVSTSSYYDSTSGKSYKPYYSGVNGYDGSSGLGSESDYTYGAKGYQYYGSSGYYEAKQGSSGSTNLYDFYFQYNDGSYYYGTVADNGSKGYYSGEKINGYNGGYYYIYSKAGSTSETSGTVSTDYYYDKTSGKSYTPYYYGQGHSDGSSGLGSEFDYTYGAKGYQYYGSSGYYEAKQG